MAENQEGDAGEGATVSDRSDLPDPGNIRRLAIALEEIDTLRAELDAQRATTARDPLPVSSGHLKSITERARRRLQRLRALPSGSRNNATDECETTLENILETALSAPSPAQPVSSGQDKPVAWMIEVHKKGLWMWDSVQPTEPSLVLDGGYRVVPLYAAPQPSPKLREKIWNALNDAYTTGAREATMSPLLPHPQWRGSWAEADRLIADLMGENP